MKKIRLSALLATAVLIISLLFGTKAFAWVQMYNDEDIDDSIRISFADEHSDSWDDWRFFLASRAYQSSPRIVEILGEKNVEEYDNYYIISSDVLEEIWFDEYSGHRYHSRYEDCKLIIPENAYGKDVIGILFSSDASEFQISDTNKYLKCVDNVIFDKSGEILLSYARYDDREQYTAPDGTEEIYDGAMIYCWNIKEVYLPKSVKEIEPSAFRGCSSLQKVVFDQSSEKLIINWYAFSGTPLLEEVILPSFSVSIDAAAFGYESRYMLFGFDNEEEFWAEYGGWGMEVLPGDSFCRLSDVKLTTYTQPTLTSDGTTIRWEEIEGATYYEVYQKLNDGEYRLLGTTSGGGCRFTTLKEGKEYTFAVKAYAEIPAANYDPEREEGVYPESFLIEGTMSEDIVLVG